MRTQKLLALLALACAAGAQTLSPQLAPLAAKHEADIKALDAQRTISAQAAQQRYLSELAAAEKASGTAGKVAEVAAIIKEREALAAGPLAPQPPAGLPKTLERRRADYLAALNAADRQLIPRYERVNGDYLRALTALEARVSGNAELLKQITDEKQKLAGAGPSTTVRELSDRLLTNSEWEWVGPEKSAGKPVWQFLADGKIKTGGEHYWNWKIVGPDQFDIRDGEKVLMHCQMDFKRMQAEVTSPGNPKVQKRLKYKGPISG